MIQMNPLQILGAIQKGQNPETLMLNMLQQNMGDNPLGQNLIGLAKNGQTQEIEKVARNLLAQQGRDFDQEFNAFKKNLGL